MSNLNPKRTKTLNLNFKELGYGKGKENGYLYFLVLVYWCTGVLVCWCAGALAYW